ncbi:hypothetical protein SLA2020_342850 [Shorea laevis]
MTLSEWRSSSSSSSSSVIFTVYMFLFHDIAVVVGVENQSSFVFVKDFRMDDNDSVRMEVKSLNAIKIAIVVGVENQSSFVFVKDFRMDDNDSVRMEVKSLKSKCNKDRY